MDDIDLSMDLCGIKVSNPIMLAAGVLGIGAEGLKAILQCGAGAVITKTIGAVPRKGYAGPTIVEPMENVVLNAMGLPNQGYREFIREFKVIKLYNEDAANIVIPSIYGRTPDEFGEVAEAIIDETTAKMLELNISCPHPEPKLGKSIIGQDAIATGKVVSRVKERVDVPVIVKLSPNVTNIVSIAKAAIENGADVISAINTVAALELDPYFGRPVLGNGVGGQSGPSIRCIAQRKIAEITTAMERGDIDPVPVIGVGGIKDALDVVRFILLGAHCVQIGSVLLHEDLNIFKRLTDDLKKYMLEKGYKSLEEFRGLALEYIM